MVLKLLLLAGVVMLLLQWRRKLRLDGERGRTASQRDAPAPVEMLACAECGVHLPRSDAVIVDGAAGPIYCCLAHRSAHRARSGRPAGR